MFESDAAREVQALKPRWRNALMCIADRAPRMSHRLWGICPGGIPANPDGWSLRDARALVRRGLLEEEEIAGWKDIPAYPGWRPTERGRLLAAGMIPYEKRDRVEERRGSSS
jgi:hypothetical protein